MGWSNYKWAWNLRGVSSAEQLVCLRLADEADANGYIDRLSHLGLTRKLPAIGRRRVREIILSLKNKKLIKTRTHRYGARGQQISNAYQLDTKRYHPPDPAGETLWRQTVALLTAVPELREGAKFHSADSSAYYEPDTKTLFVFLDSKRSLTFFNFQRPNLTNKTFEFSPPVQRLDFILPGSDQT